MKNNTVSDSQPALTLPRLGSRLGNLAENLSRFAMEFGVEVTEHFPMRLATIGFANGVMLRINDPASAAGLEHLLAGESIPTPDEARGLTGSFVEAFKGEEDWTHEANCFLRNRWNPSSDNKAQHDARLQIQLRVLHGISAGLIVARESPDTAQKIAGHVKTLWHENQFLARCLYGWSDHEWEPHGHPFVEFMAAWYRTGSVERWVMRTAVAEVVPVAKALNDPWALRFWAETGWNGGRNLVRGRQEHLRNLLNEAGSEILKAYLGLYGRCVLGTARCGGEIDIERATLRSWANSMTAALPGASARAASPGGLPGRPTTSRSGWASSLRTRFLRLPEARVEDPSQDGPQIRLRHALPFPAGGV